MILLNAGLHSKTTQQPKRDGHVGGAHYLFNIHELNIKTDQNEQF